MSLAEKNDLVEHVEDLQPRLMDGEENCSVGAGHLVQALKQLNGGGGVQSGGRLIQKEEAGHGEELYRHAQTPLLPTAEALPSCSTHYQVGLACEASLIKVEVIQMTENMVKQVSQTW